jgi:SPP1 family predicted phage head-tail adaptor
MTIPAGSLDTRVAITQRSTTQDALGQPVDTWSPLATLWADVRYQTGLQRALAADAPHAATKLSIRVRQSGCARDIAPGMRAQVGAQVYTVVDVLPQGREALDLVCREVSS